MIGGPSKGKKAKPTMDKTSTTAVDSTMETDEEIQQMHSTRMDDPAPAVMSSLLTKEIPVSYPLTYKTAATSTPIISELNEAKLKIKELELKAQAHD
ncbi:hypothetical protein L2E82_22074 [Cichorium intybus]|uniref:Uncharacterized protein n=1 Tax=Cichorium intybus TaxID=13427 RepID=A0ACB9DX72_CICIN|nr:hypothetical protein L2E82_22074 [Cichorium intybus]